MTTSRSPVRRLKGSIPCLTLIAQGDQQFEIAVASGCLLEERNRLFWLTAGHVINRIEALRDGGRLRAAHWQDGLHPAVPAILDGWSRLAVDDAGLDFGIVELPALHADNLRAASHYKAFVFDDCIESGSPEAVEMMAHGCKGDAYVLGYPQEWARIETHRHGPGSMRADVTIRPVQIPLLHAVTRAEVEGEFGPTSESFWSPLCTYARIPAATRTSKDTEPLWDIGGVSGGPVIIQIDGRDRLLGSQVSWLPGCRIVRLLPINFVKAVLHRYFAFLDEKSS